MSRIYPHAEDCECGSDESQLPLKRSNPWYVKSKPHHNCFFTYIRHNVRPHTLQEVADLLDLSISAITSVERKAFMKLRGKIQLLKASEK